MSIQLLFIEDDEEKRNRINEFLKKNYDINIVDKQSYHSGLLELVANKPYDLVLIDMSMPNYDITANELEERSYESYAGRELLEQMKFRYINYPTIIITQFASFGEYVEKLSLDELIDDLEKNFSPTYQATVYYNASESTWKEELKNQIDKIIGVTE